MANKKLKSEVLKHFKEVGVVYDKKAFNDFFKDFATAFVTDHLDLTKKKNKKDFDMLKFTIILLFEEHEHIINKLNNTLITQSVTHKATQKVTHKATRGDTQWK